MVTRRVRLGDKITIGNNWAAEAGESVIQSSGLSGPEGSIQYGDQSGDKFVAYEIEPLVLGNIDLTHSVTFTDGRHGERKYRLEVHA